MLKTKVTCKYNMLGAREVVELVWGGAGLRKGHHGLEWLRKAF